MPDDTNIWTKSKPTYDPGESHIFGVTIRGWLASMIVSTICLCIIAMVFLAYLGKPCDVKIPGEFWLLGTTVVMFFFQKQSAAPVLPPNSTSSTQTTTTQTTDTK
jgi:hypothetical protein